MPQLSLVEEALKRAGYTEYQINFRALASLFAMHYFLLVMPAFSVNFREIWTRQPSLKSENWVKIPQKWTRICYFFHKIDAALSAFGFLAFGEFGISLDFISVSTVLVSCIKRRLRDLLQKIPVPNITFTPFDRLTQHRACLLFTNSLPCTVLRSLFDGINVMLGTGIF